MRKTQYFQMEFKNVDVKEENGKLIIEGYASTPDVDSYNDIVKPEAFKDTMVEYMEKHKGQILLQHIREKIVGKTIDYRIDDGGLWIKVELYNDIDGLFKNIQSGMISAFSIGFRALSWEIKKEDEKRIRVITKLQLIEISAVNGPANTNATFSLSKSIKSFFDNLEGLKSLATGVYEVKSAGNIHDDKEEFDEKDISFEEETKEEETPEEKDIGLEEEKNDDDEEKEEDDKEEKGLEAEESLNSELKDLIQGEMGEKNHVWVCEIFEKEFVFNVWNKDEEIEAYYRRGYKSEDGVVSLEGENIKVKPEKRWVDVVKSNIEALEEKDETPEGAAPEGGEETEEAAKEDKQTDDTETGGENPSDGDEDVKSAEVKALKEKVESLENNETELKGQLEAKDQEISDLREQLETAENNLEAKEEEMKEYLGHGGETLEKKSSKDGGEKSTQAWVYSEY